MVNDTIPCRPDKVEDVHSHPDYFQKEIDLILHHPNNTTTTIDLKVDSY